MTKPHRNTIFLEEAKILAHEHYAGDQHVLRLAAPGIAAKAGPGSFVHLTCDASRPLRRPISIMRSDRESGEVQLLYKAFGKGTHLLAERRVGERISTLGPIGNGFTVDRERKRPLLIGGGVGIPPMIFLAEEMRRTGGYEPLVLMGSEVPFPFRVRPSQILVPGIPDGVTGAMPLLEDWDIASRLCSLQGYAGCHEGFVTDLARHWLDAMDAAQRKQVAIYACGPHPMLEAIAGVAENFGVTCQVSMEEFMACGVGGCAGCTIQVTTESGPAMKRVCVDGPVFDAESVF